MITQELSRRWTLRPAQRPQAVPGEVPGSVYADLLRASLGPDPYWRDSLPQARALLDQGFTYQCVFQPEAGLLGCKEILLRMEGVDGLAAVELNGSPLGAAANMHRVYEFPVSYLLHPGENRLTVAFQPPAGGHPRKAGYTDGRFGPRFPDGGLWRPVKLLGLEGARLKGVRIRQEHRDGRVRLFVGYSAECQRAGVRFSVALAGPQGEDIPFPEGAHAVNIENPRLWWPRGYGEQPLYTVRVEARLDGRVLDSWEGKTGLRTVGLDTSGGGFAHVVNGVKIFAMGGGYLPEDCLASRRSPARTRRLLEDCAAANFNCLRVRGEGFYPEDEFYDLCDQLGLLVWQDMMFSGGDFPRGRAAIQDAQAELEDNIQRMQRHPCIALWCGNAGMEAGLEGADPKTRADYIKFFEYVAPETLYQIDPHAPYWPSSPSSGGGFDEPSSRERGDSRLGGESGAAPRYASELGQPSPPCLRTIEAFTEPRDRNPHSYVMEAHQPQDIGPLAALSWEEFLYPAGLDAAVYASQLAQAFAARQAVEELRRQRGRCMGALLRQVNDCWPGASWSSIDYGGRWKPLQYLARRFFAPLLLACRALGAEDGAGPVKNPQERALALAVVNDTGRGRQVTVKWALRDGLCRVKREETISLRVPAHGCAQLDSVPLPEVRPFEDFVSCELLEGGGRVSFETVIFCRNKHFRFMDPGLTCRVEGDEAVVSAKAYARGVEVRNGGEDLVVGDNYFDMMPGERRLKILRGEARGLRARSVYSLRD